MRAIIVEGSGKEATLALAEMPAPRPGEHDYLVRVRAAGINRADLRRVQQHFPGGGPDIAGLEIAGEVVEAGAAAASVPSGYRVMAMAPRAYAEFAVVDSRLAIPIPNGIGWTAAAAIPVWYMTAHNALVTAGGLSRGAAVLVTAAASGIGIAAVQLARLFGASTVLGTGSSASRLESLAALGLDHPLVMGDGALGDRVRTLTKGSGVDVIIDMVGGGMLGDLVECAALGGRIVSVGRLGGFVDSIDLDKLALKRLSLIGVTFRSLDLEGRCAIRDRMVGDLEHPFADGSLGPVVDCTFPLEQALTAQDYVKQNRHFGKVVLTL